MAEPNWNTLRNNALGNLNSTSTSPLNRTTNYAQFLQASRNISGLHWNGAITTDQSKWRYISSSGFTYGNISPTVPLYPGGPRRRNLYFDVRADLHVSSGTLYIGSPGAINNLGQQEALNAGTLFNNSLSTASRLRDAKAWIAGNLGAIVAANPSSIQLVGYSIGSNEIAYITAYLRQHTSIPNIEVTYLAPYHLAGLSDLINKDGLSFNNAKGTVYRRQGDLPTAADLQPADQLAAIDIKLPDYYVVTIEPQPLSSVARFGHMGPIVRGTVDTIAGHDLTPILEDIAAGRTNDNMVVVKMPNNTVEYWSPTQFTNYLNSIRSQGGKFVVGGVDVLETLLKRLAPGNTALASGANAELPNPNPNEVLRELMQSIQAGEYVGSLVGSTLGRALFDDSIAGATLAAGLLSAVGARLGKAITVGVQGKQVLTQLRQAVTDVATVKDLNLANSLASSAIGTVSSLMTVELADSLGLDGVAGEVFGNVVGGTLHAAIQNAANGQSLLAGFSTADDFLTGSSTFGGVSNLVGSAIASYLGVKLGSLVVQPSTQAGVVLSSLGSAAGAWAFGTTAGGLGWGKGLGTIAEQFLGKWISFNVLAPGVGALIGFVLGALVGNLFGKKRPPAPSGSAETELQVPFARYEIADVTANSTGNREMVTSMATAARDLLNGMITTIVGGAAGSQVANLNGLATDQVYGHNSNNIYVRINGNTTNGFATPDAAVDFGVLNAIRNTMIVGGDLFAKRILFRSQHDSLISLLGDLKVADDYRQFMLSSEEVSDLIDAGRAQMDAADQSYFDANPNLIYAALMAADGGGIGTSYQSAYNANKTQIDRIVDLLRPTPTAASWVVALQRAAELRLDEFAASDFYGGFKGFLGSFQNVGIYEAFSIAWDPGSAGLVVTADTRTPENVFGFLPQSSADGKTLTIGNFASIMGYSAGTASASNDVYLQSTSFTPISISFGTGNDIVHASFGADWVHGNQGEDFLDGNNGNDTVVGGAGNDVVLGRDGNDWLTGDGGDDYLFGGSGADDARGGEGNDTIGGGGGADTMFGGNGNDVLISHENDGAADYIDGEAGTDQLSFERYSVGVSVNLAAGTIYGDTVLNVEGARGSAFNDALTAGASAALLMGLAGNDTLTGGAADDTIEGGAGADVLAGNGGNDTLSYANSRTGVLIDLTTLDALGDDATGDVISGFEHVRGSMSADELKGSSVANRLEGMGGDDRLIATSGSDTLDGGEGEDVADYSEATSSVTIYIGSSANGVQSNGSASSGFGTHTLINMESALGSAFNDSISAGGGIQTFYGGPGADTLSGGQGADNYVFYRGDGQDLIFEDTEGWNNLSLGSDILFQDLAVGSAGGAGGFLDIFIRGTSDSVRVSGNWVDANNPKLKTLEIGGSKLDLSQALNVPGTMTDGSDTIVGTSGFGDLLFGYNGADFLRTSPTVDDTSHVFVGGLGNDTLWGGTADDCFGFDVNGALGPGQIEEDYIDDFGGEDTLVMGSSIKAEDVIYEVVNGHLYIGVKDAANPTLSASQVSNRVWVKDGAVKFFGPNYPQDTFNFDMVEYVSVAGTNIDLRKLDLPWVRRFEPNGDGHGPIVFDLEGDGVDLTLWDESRIVAKSDGGVITKLGWLGPTDAFLAVDRDGDGAINRLSEISFTQDAPGAGTDLEGLRAWDTNADGVLDAKDEGWAKLKVWVDRNQDGRSAAPELRTLDQAGITSINLKGEPTGMTAGRTSESYAVNKLSYTTANGGGTAYDVVLSRRLANSEGRYAAGYKDDMGDLDVDAELGRVLNDARADALAAEGRVYDVRGAIDTRGVTYDAWLNSAMLDFSGKGAIDPGVAAQFAYRLDPGAREAWSRRQQGEMDQKALAAIIATAASDDRPGARGRAGAAGGAAAALGFTESAPVASTSFAEDLASVGSLQVRSEGGLEQDSGSERTDPLVPAARPAELPLAASDGAGDVNVSWWRHASGGEGTLAFRDNSLSFAELAERTETFGAKGVEAAAADGISIDPQRQQLLLRQAIAGFGGETAMAPVWLRTRDEGGDEGLLSATEGRFGASPTRRAA